MTRYDSPERYAPKPPLLPPVSRAPRAALAADAADGPELEVAPVVRFEALGYPAPKGSKRPFTNKRTGKSIVVEQCAKTLAPWKESVQWAAKQKLMEVGLIAGYIEVRLDFTFPKPDSAYRGPKSKKPRAFPNSGDIDKIVRSTLDCLSIAKRRGQSGAGLIEDDRKVVGLTAWKHFPGEGPLALDSPGVRIEIRRLS